jgi:hypothetical protein
VIEHICSCLRRRLTSKIGGWSDGKEDNRKERCSRQGVEDFAGQQSQVLAANSSGTGIVGAQARRFPDRARRRAARRQFLLRNEREGASKRQKNPTPEATAIFFLLQHFSLSHTNQTTKTPPICLSTRCDSHLSGRAATRARDFPSARARIAALPLDNSTTP